MGSHESTDSNQPITTSRVTNVFLMVWYVVAIVLHVVCLSVIAAKHNELVDKFSDDKYGDEYNDWVKKGCILFIDYDEKSNEINWVNNRCNIVIYGSAALGGCALLMIAFLIVRTLLFRK